MNDLISNMLRTAVGVNPWFFDGKSTSKYPPHRISQIGDNYRLTMAVAGFTEEELEITVQNEYLTVTGKKTIYADVDEPLSYNALSRGRPANPLAVEVDRGFCLLQDETNVLYNGIAFRNFSSQFMIGDVEIAKATLNYGLLEIDLIRNIPESKKLKKISISS